MIESDANGVTPVLGDGALVRMSGDWHVDRNRTVLSASSTAMIDGAMQDFPLTLDRFLDHAAKWHPGAEVVTGGAGGAVDRIGYAALKARSQRVSSVLMKFDVAFGDRVATLAWNTQAHVEAFYAIMGIGAVCHTLNPRLPGAQLAEMATKAGCRLLIASADLLGLAREIAESAPQLELILVIDGFPGEMEPGPGRASVLALAMAMADEPDAAVWGGFDERSPSGLCFTSGTTGAPKGVTYTHRSSFLHTLRLLQTDVIGLRATDSVLVAVPMFHGNAWGLPFAAPAVGARLVLPGRHTDGERLARLIASEGVTVAVGVPTVWLGLIEHVEASGEALPSLERIIVGGAPLPPALMIRLERGLDIEVQTSWGMTELSPSGTISAFKARDRSAASSGRPAIGVDLMLTDIEGHALPEQRGVEGHLRVRGSAVIERYFGQDHRVIDEAGWFATGDLARIERDGNLIITGRSKDLIKSGGEWINPGDIESIVGELPEIVLAAVIGRADQKWGERPILLVEAREGWEVHDERLLAALQGRVASWWLPDAIISLPRMPLTPTGKVDKMRLRLEYGSG